MSIPYWKIDTNLGSKMMKILRGVTKKGNAMYRRQTIKIRQVETQLRNTYDSHKDLIANMLRRPD